MEKWDAYLKNGMKTELLLTRGQPIPDGLYHLVVDVLVQHNDGDLLFMQRALDRRGYPGYFEASAGGSALAGEIAEQAALRELEEETGIVPWDCHLVKIKRYDNDACFIHTFIARTDCDKEDIRLQEGETIAYKWVPLSDIDNFLNTHKVIPRQKDYITPLTTHGAR